MTVSEALLSDAAARLLRHAPGTDWWPGQPWTVAISAILVQQTTWQQAARAVSRLGDAALDPDRLRELAPGELGARIRCSGFWRRKARSIADLAATWPELNTCPFPGRRQRLLEIAGIGPETADAICCYAFDDPVLVVDAMTARLTSRLTGQPVSVRSYDALQEQWSNALDAPNNRAFRLLHAAIVEHARNICTARTPRCTGCHLHAICAHGNPSRTIASH